MSDKSSKTATVLGESAPAYVLAAAHQLAAQAGESEAQLQHQLKDLQDELTQARQRFEEMIHRLAKTELLLEREKTQNERLRQQLQDSLHANRDLKQQYDDRDAEIARLRLTLERLSASAVLDIDGVSCTGPILD